MGLCFSCACGLGHPPTVSLFVGSAAVARRWEIHGRQRCHRRTDGHLGLLEPWGRIGDGFVGFWCTLYCYFAMKGIGLGL